MASLSWFRVGGPAEVLFTPADTDDLSSFLRNRPKEIPITVVGVGSNLLVRDGGIKGIVIRFGRGFTFIEPTGIDIRAGVAALDVMVARAAQRVGIGGLEFFRGIPGTVGGALRMNAGAYGRETKDVFVSCVAVDDEGTVHELSISEMGFRYRGSSISKDWIFTEAVFRGVQDDPDIILERMDEITRSREDTQPVKSRTGGSTFKNPDMEISGGRKAWQLIDEAGCRGLKIGGARVSEQHCNFLINEGDATADDLETLGETVREKVLEKTGVELDWEIKRIGERLVA